MQDHSWRDSDEEGVIFYRATHHGGRWKMASQRKGKSRKSDEEWVHYDPIPDELLEKLREIVFNKYQRGRCAWKLVAGVDKLLGRDPVDPGNG